MPSLLGLTDEERMKLREQRTAGLFNLEGIRPLNPETTSMPLLPEKPAQPEPQSGLIYSSKDIRPFQAPDTLGSPISEEEAVKIRSTFEPTEGMPMPDVWQGMQYIPGGVSTPEQQKSYEEQSRASLLGGITKSVDVYNEEGKKIGEKEVPDTATRAEALLGVGKFKPAQEKEFNMSVDLDTILPPIVSKYGVNMATPEGRKQAYQLYATNPDVKAEFDKEWNRRRITAPPIVVNVPGFQTPEGQPVSQNLRTGTIIPAKGGEVVVPRPTEKDIEFKRSYTSADTILDQLDQRFKEIESEMATSATERITGAPGRAIKSYTQISPKLASTQALSEATLSKLIRALGEIGTLTNQDIERARMAIPSIHDTVDVKNNKIQQLRELVGEIYERGQREGVPTRIKTPIKGKTQDKDPLGIR